MPKCEKVGNLEAVAIGSGQDGEWGGRCGVEWSGNERRVLADKKYSSRTEPGELEE